MTVFTSVIFLCLVLVDDYLISLALLEDLSFYCASLYEWCAYDKLVSAYSYDFVKYYCVAYVCNELLYSENQTRRSLGATLENPLRAVNRRK